MISTLKSNSSPTAKFLTREQLSDRWSCSVSSIKRMEAAHELQATILGRRIVRYPLVHIEAIENQRATKA